ncbi:protein-methionine-sulfoxide reductase heme-binding subunit MsrQ [Sedimentitalea arenosa]|uniref:Protein-methionine-sulfoxide reductase heme-binding subunit MsrQ n=1 Tax=Sedimentitalea arenosa TaxID=2798803 RepID=A0A8J7LT70_9RHOB|nr:protein-methionine-sulfoxide reductase heme-binding subunit MsrQ [Arenibacterium arenosum]MBJ6372774.1 protein-methionine-sulfoxide reductase heme-binding subunit MsrQ [Arenibacterium arenosum]
MFVDRLNGAMRRVPVWPVYVVGALPPGILLYMGATGALGVEPIKALEHELGELALKMLLLGLAVTPVRRFLGVNLMRFRRAIGLITFYYVLCHLMVWLVLDVQIVGQIWADIVKRPYITVGMAAFVLMVPLAVTSNDWSVRRLGPTWRTLHKAVYGIAILGGLHFLMLTKGFQVEPLAYMAVILALLALRVAPRRRKATTGREISDGKTVDSQEPGESERRVGRNRGGRLV